MPAMSEAKEDLLLSCLMSVASSPPYIYPHMPQGRGAEVAREEGKVLRRRRRRKARGDGREGSSSEVKKRRLTDEQARLLEISFSTDRKLESERKNQLAAELGLDPKQVAVWFQNRRCRLKSKQLEEELVHLKSAHDQAILDKCELEKEVLILKEKLCIAEEGMKKLTTTGTSGGNGERGGGEGCPCSSLCKGTYQPLLGEFEVEGGVPELDLYLSDYSSMLDWVDFYGF